MEKVVSSQKSGVSSRKSLVNSLRFVHRDAIGLVWKMVGSSEDMLQQFEHQHFQCLFHAAEMLLLYQVLSYFF